MQTIKYLKYILIHKWWVFIYCVRLGIPFRGLIHDLSKFLPSEWFAYKRYFYGKHSKNFDINDAFNVAWLRHQNRNKHHWQYWVLIEDSGKVIFIRIPLKYLKEMVADWIGAGIAITGKLDIMEWYQKK